MRSSTSSMPVEILTRSSGKPLAARISAGMDAWDMKQGKEMRLLVLLKDTVILKSLDSSTMILDRSTLPVAKERMDPARRLASCAARIPRWI